MFLLILIFLALILIQFGWFPLIQIIIWLFVLFSSNILIGINPFSQQYRVIRIISILVIIFILYYNAKLTLISTIILPFSINKISFLEDIDKTIQISDITQKEKILLYDNNKLSKFLNNLKDETNYVVNISFIPDIVNSSIDCPQMLLSKPILVNKFSSPTTLAQYINERLYFMIDCYYLDDSILQQNVVGPGLIFYYWKLKIQ
jgi:hypothetical protein